MMMMMMKNIEITMENSYVGVAGKYSPHPIFKNIYPNADNFVLYQTCYTCSAVYMVQAT